MHRPVSHPLIKYGSSCEETEEKAVSMAMAGLYWPKRPGYLGNWLQFGENEFAPLSSQKRRRLPETHSRS